MNLLQRNILHFALDSILEKWYIAKDVPIRNSYIPQINHQQHLFFACTQKYHEKLTVRGVGVKPYGQPDRKISFFITLPLDISKARKLLRIPT